MAKRLKGRPFPVPVIALTDFALTAVLILGFAYFHHVRPQAGENDVTKLPQSVIPAGNQYGAQYGDPSTTVTGTETGGYYAVVTTPSETDSSGNAIEATTTSASEGIGSETSQLIPDNQTTGNVSGVLVGTETTAAPPNGETQAPGVTTTPTKTTTTTTTTTIKYDLSGWGYKWPEKFMIDDSVEITDKTYKSHDVNVTMRTVEENGVVYHVADVYIRYLENFATAFAQDTYGKGIIEWPQDMAARHNAICAVNGDYYGSRDDGIVIRNAVCYRDVKRQEVLAMYYDGTMQFYMPDDFNTETALANGCYQTFTFGPTVVANGVVRDYSEYSVSGSLYTTRAPRSGVGYYEPGHYCFVTIDGRSEASVGATSMEQGQIFVDLGCQLAYNLDGGATAMMVYQDEVYNVPSWGGSDVSGRQTSDILMIVEK